VILHGKEFASNAVCRIEHTWREEKENNPFCEPQNNGLAKRFEL